MTTFMRQLALLIFFSVKKSTHAFHLVHRGSSQRLISTLFASGQQEQSPTRRDVLSLPIGIAAAGLSTAFIGTPQAQARGLVRFPCTQPLGNTYHFLRAGTSLLEAEDILSTNPLFVTNREAALSSDGVKEVEATIESTLARNNINPTIIRYSIAAAATDTCNIVGRELKVGRDRLVPEFNYLEPRAIGAWDMLSVRDTTKAVWAMDALEAGPEGQGGRPPPNDDGTPHETLANVSVRLRQLISVMETQYSGDAVLVVACDGTTLALLSCMIAGIPYNRVHELEYAPGEARLNVDMESTLALLKEKEANSENYQKVIQEGTVELKRLREMKDIISLKDQKFEEEQAELESEFKRQQVERQKQEDKEKQARLDKAEKITADNKSTSPAISPVAIGGVGIGAIGIAVAAGGTEDTTEPAAPTNSVDEDVDADMPSPPEQQEPEPDVFLPPPPKEERAFDPAKDGLVKSSRPLVWEDKPVIPQGVTGRRRPEPQVVADDPTLRIDLEQAAEEAMEAYLNQDDGGEEWLKIMAEMAQSDDDDEGDDV